MGRREGGGREGEADVKYSITESIILERGGEGRGGVGLCGRKSQGAPPSLCMKPCIL